MHGLALAPTILPRVGGTNRAGAILLILQGMDTSGKGGMIRNALSVFDPQGLKPISFGAPNAEELSHDFLWRIQKHTAAGGNCCLRSFSL